MSGFRDRVQGLGLKGLGLEVQASGSFLYVKKGHRNYLGLVFWKVGTL